MSATPSTKLKKRVARLEDICTGMGFLLLRLQNKFESDFSEGMSMQVRHALRDYKQIARERLQRETATGGTSENRMGLPRMGMEDVRTEIGRQSEMIMESDARRLDWVMHHVNGKAWRELGVLYSSGCDRAAIDAAMTQAAQAKGE